MLLVLAPAALFGPDLFLRVLEPAGAVQPVQPAVITTTLPLPDTKAGPMVIEIPPKVLGSFNDFWYKWVADVGITGADKGAAAEVGKLIAARAVAAGVKEVIFDRGGYTYHGRIAALANAAREGGLSF